MPGHFLAAIGQYPELVCDGLIGWGKTFSSPICPGKDTTLEFCQNVFKEVFAPSLGDRSPYMLSSRNLETKSAYYFVA